jgi:protein-disulfide isomerase
MPIFRRTLLSVVAMGASVPTVAWAVDAHQTDRAVGSPKAPRTAVEFFSLTCPHCAHFGLETFPELDTKWIQTGKLRWVFYDFPTDGLALLAAMIARSLPPQKYPPFVTALFKEQDRWAYASNPQDALWLIAHDAGMERTAFDHAVADTQLRDWILSRAQDAQSHWNVNATPSFLIDGKLYEGAMAASDFAALLNG